MYHDWLRLSLSVLFSRGNTIRVWEPKITLVIYLFNIYKTSTSLLSSTPTFSFWLRLLLFFHQSLLKLNNEQTFLEKRLLWILIGLLMIYFMLPINNYHKQLLKELINIFLKTIGLLKLNHDRMLITLFHKIVSFLVFLISECD